MNRKFTFFFAVLVLAALLFSSSFAEEEANVTYGETYLCGDAFTARIVQQPQMFAQSGEKIQYYVPRLNAQNRWSAHQIYVQHGIQTEEDVMLVMRVQLRNMNSKQLQGLSAESFVLTGKVRDRVIEYRPEVMIPFVMQDDDWELPMIRAGLDAYYLARTTPDSITYNINDYWNPLLMEEKVIDSMRVWEIRLVYRVPSWLVGWDLHVRPAPVIADETLKTCDLTLHLPTIMNEITRETYKYIY